MIDVKAELMAVIIGLQWVEEGRPDREEYYIDSVAGLLRIQTLKSNSDHRMLELKHWLHRLLELE